MARLESKARAGFYPTPLTVTELVCRLLSRPVLGRPRVFDPCAGEGIFAAALAESLGAESYGVEVNEERAAAAATRLDTVLCTDALTMRVSHEAFGLLALNPPYDDDSEARRLEHAFLQKCTPYLVPGGVLAFLIPQIQLAVSARYLAAWYSDLRVWRFPDPEFGAYRQIVLLARRRARGARDRDEEERLVALSGGQLPPLEAGACPPYVVPAGREPAPRLEAGQFDAGAAVRAARAGLWVDPTLVRRLWPSEAPRVQPLMPLKRGHVAQFGVAGLLDNCVLLDAGGRPHVVKGRTVKETLTTVEEDPEGVTRTERDVIRTSLTLLDLDAASFVEVGTGSAGQAGAAQMALPDFLERFRESITARILAEYRPLYTPAQRHLFAEHLARLRRRPRGAQADVIRALALALREGRRGVILSGEMGSGKSLCGAAAAYCAGARSILIVSPPHLVHKWQREVEGTIPGARVGIARTPTDLQRILALPQDRWSSGPLVTVISRERAKLSYAWKPAACRRLARGGEREGAGMGQRALLACPSCGAFLVDSEGIPLGLEDLRRRRLRCQAPLVGRRGGVPVDTGRICGSPLWQADREGPRRIALADYIKRRLPRAYDLLLLDEVHEMKARGSAQGMAAAALAATIPRTLALTGTLFGGLASSLFYLLYRLLPEVRAEFKHTDELRWASLYGLLERVTREKKGDRYSEDGAQSKRRAYLTQVREKPGIMPSLIVRLVRDTAFLRLADVADDLPPYAEAVLLYRMDPDQEAAYGRLQRVLYAELVQALHAGSQRLLGAYLQTLLAYPDSCWRAETVTERVAGPDGGVRERVLVHEDALPEDITYPKERGLVELVRREALLGRRVLVYVAHTERRDITGRLAALLGRAGLRAAVLKSDTVAPERREEWIEARVKEGLHAMIVHPRCVQTGMDLLAFPTVLFYEVEYSTYVLRQASRRSWRIGQTQPVKVLYTAYEGSMQATALALIARKLRASLLVDGELTEDGLSEFADDGDFFLDLARSVATGQQADAEGGLEELFAAARTAAQEAGDDLLADEDRAPAVVALLPRPAPAPGESEVVTIALSALREAFFAAGKPRRVPDEQLSLFDLSVEEGR